MEDRTREVKVSLSVINGGLAIDWGWLGITPPERFERFFHAVLQAAHFHSPGLVRRERNDPAAPGRRTDWNRIRINAEECESGGVNPWLGIRRIRNYLEDEAGEEYGLSFSVTVEGDGPVSAYSDAQRSSGASAAY